MGPSTLNIGVIDGGRAPNVIADAANAQVLVRLVGPSEQTRKAIEEAVAGLAEVEFTLEIPFIRMRQVEGLETMVAAFTTDIPALSNWGEPLLLGPGSIHVAHTPFEKIAKHELLRAVDLYFDVASQTRGMMTFGWPTRLKYGVLAALAGWLAGFLVTFPFELALARRYVDGNGHRLPDSLAEGLVVWGAFSLFMALSGFVPLMLPLVLLIGRLDRALAPHSDPGRPAARPCGHLRAHGAVASSLLPAYESPSRFLRHRAQFLCSHIRPGGDLGVCGAGETTALRSFRQGAFGPGGLKQFCRLGTDDTPDQRPCRSFLLLSAIRHASAGSVA